MNKVKPNTYRKRDCDWIHTKERIFVEGIVARVSEALGL